MTGTTGKEILLVDDDESFRLTLGEDLRLSEGIITVEAKSGTEALSLVKGKSFDAILLDVGLPDMDGRDVCRVMRRSGVKSPIIILSCAESIADTILGLDAGANDYVTKPFHLGILLARLRAHVRQYEQSEVAIRTIGPYTFRPSVKLLIHNETRTKISLSAKETSILMCLYRSRSNVVSRETLVGEVWGYNAGGTIHAAQTLVYRLRQKIESDPSKPKILVTRQGGYELVC